MIFRKDVGNMKKLAIYLMVIIGLLSLTCCAKTDKENPAQSANTITVPATEEAESSNEVLQFLTDKYDLKFTLWGPEGQDLYAFHVYPNYAERECHILMPANTDDVAEYHKGLSWEVVGDELIIAGEWQETFRIDITAETATSTTTDKVYKLYEMQPPLE